MVVALGRCVCALCRESLFESTSTRLDTSLAPTLKAVSSNSTGRLKMREWKMRYGQKCKGGKCRSGKCSRLVVWKAEPILYSDTALIKLLS